MSKDDFTVLHLDLSSLESVRQFVDNFRYDHLEVSLCAMRGSSFAAKFEVKLEDLDCMPDLRLYKAAC